MIYIELNEDGKITYSHSNPFDSMRGLGLTEEQLRIKGYLIEEIPPLKKGYKYRIDSDGIETKLELVKDDSREIEIDDRLNIAEQSIKELSAFYNTEFNEIKDKKETLDRLTSLEKALYKIMEVIYNV